MVKRDKKFELLLKEFIETEGEYFSNREDAIEVFEHIYNMVEEGYDVDGPLGDIVDAIDDSDMSVFNKVSALRELYEENHSGIEMAIELGEDILYSESDEDTEEMILADALAGYYVKAGMYEEAAKLYELLLKASPSDFSEVTDELTHVYVHLNRDNLMRNHIKRFDYLESEPTLLLLSVFSINQGKLDEAHYYMTKLKELNKYTGIIFKGGFEKVESFIEGTLQDEKDLQKPEVFEMHFAANIAKDYLTSKYHYELLEKFYKEEIEKSKNLKKILEDLELEDLEIEDLILEELDKESIKGKRFCKDGSNGESGTVGKAMMAQHVLRNYRTIDLSGLRPLLDNLKKVVSGYNNGKFNIGIDS